MGKKEGKKRMKYITTFQANKVLLDTKKDELIYDGLYAHYMRTSQNNATRGIDLYVKRSKVGNVFYTLHWSRWQGESSYIQVLDLDEAKEFIEGNFDYFTTEDDVKQLEEVGLYNPTEML